METLSAAKIQSWLSWFLRGLLILGFLILLGRLTELQIIKGDYFRDLSEGNRIRRVPITAPRGRILARGGEILVDNIEVKRRVVFSPQKGYEKLDDIGQAADDEIITEYEREYSLGEAFAHASGYLGEVNEDEVGKINPQCPEKGTRSSGALVGRSGLEHEYDCVLSGIDGEELVEVDTSGVKIRVLGRKEAVPGEDIRTSIHLGLQKKIAEEMKGSKGAVVATDAKGQVLALYSSPSFDPNLFLNKNASDEISALINNQDLPFFNRAIGGQYHPGSVFKPLVAIAALQEKKIDEDYKYEDTGQIVIDTLYGKFTYSNWYFTQYGGKEGEISLVRALARSTDTFFYKLGEMVGIDKLNLWADKFGLSERTGVDLPGEITGLVPSPEWKQKVKGEDWFLGNTYHVSIGQGDLSLTPIEVNTAFGVIASGGELCSPRIVGEPFCKKLDITRENLSLVKQGMEEACVAGGTGYTFFDFTPKVACKTGTAETNEDGKTHAWFVVFAPADFPEILLTTLVEGGGEGSRVAGPIAREIFDYWFGLSHE
jgi:penicillin-binding protein 2